MKGITLAVASLTLITASGLSHGLGLETKTIQRLTIEEIGTASGGLGTSAAYNLGGEAAAYLPSGIPFDSSISGFVSSGSMDGGLVMGIVQANDAFTPGYIAGGTPGEINTSRGAPSGRIAGGTMFLEISGLTTEFGGFSFSLSPDDATLITAVSEIDSTHYFYTADWSHTVKSGEVFDLTTGFYSTGFNGWALVGHLEGVAVSAVPEADTYAMMLSGLCLLGVMVQRRRKEF